MQYITPVYNRAETDISNKNSKAFMNVLDWQRIHNNTEVAKLLMDALLRTIINQNTLTAPVITTIPLVAEINLFIENINLLHSSSGLPALTGLVNLKDDWVAGRSAGAPNYVVVNSWEQVLDIVYHAIVRSADYFVYCGVAGTGQVRIWQHRWRYFWVRPSETPVRRARTGIAISGVGLIRNNDFRRYD